MSCPYRGRLWDGERRGRENLRAEALSYRGECQARLSVLDEVAQAAESVVPLPGDQIKVAAHILEALLIQLPDALPAVPCAAHETRVLHDAQVFGDCLTRDVEASGKPRDGRRPVIT